MKENSRIRFNPVTKEIEVEGSESFVTTYFNKLQKMISGSQEAAVTEERKNTRTAKIHKPAIAKVEKAGKKEPRKKKLTNTHKVLTVILGAPKGIETAKLKEKTGLNELQIWSIVNRATKEGKIRKIKRGVYGAVASS